MKQIAYLVLAHADPKHFEKLVNAIDYRAKIFVHLDAKTDIKSFQTSPLPENLTFLPNRLSVSWGGISIVNATLRLIECALKSGGDFSHLVLLSGSDYPIKDNAFIYETFVSNPEHEFIKYVDMRQSLHYIKHINQKWYKEPIFYTSNRTFELSDKAIRNVLNRISFSNSWDKSVIPYFGSQWWAFTPACAQYILNYIKVNNNYFKRSKNTFAPDEHFFHTIVGNSPFSVKSDGLQEYKGRGTWRMANFHLIHKTLSKWYTLNDLDEIISSDKLFVRKVNSLVSTPLIDLINEKILIKPNRLG